MQPQFAIIEPNILTGIGLQAILEDIIPGAEIKLLQTFEELEMLETNQFVHFFVSSRIYFEHTQFFRQQSARSIVLVNGDMTISGPHGSMPMPPHSHKPSELILSPREIEVALLLSKGYINKEVADHLNISLATVISHRKNIMDKLHARSLADIIVYVVMNGLIDVSEL